MIRLVSLCALTILLRQGPQVGVRAFGRVLQRLLEHARRVLGRSAESIAHAQQPCGHRALQRFRARRNR